MGIEGQFDGEVMVVVAGGGGAHCFPWGCLLERGDPACRSVTCERDIMKCEWLSP